VQLICTLEMLELGEREISCTRGKDAVAGKDTIAKDTIAKDTIASEAAARMQMKLLVI
jgi:hypothetical protein